MAESITADYLVIGAGAMGLAFVDTLLADTKFTVAIVDRYDCPGGHWNRAYPFVRLHQPSNFYGVNSKNLGNNTIDKFGTNKGLYELATSGEVLAYFGQVMDQHFLPSGRVQYFPNCTYTSDGRFSSNVSGKTYQIAETYTRIVDATYMRVKVPSMGPPAYDVEAGVTLVTPNDLPKATRPYANYTVVGAGKTGIDTVLWLLSRNLDPSKITWIMPRDSWLLDRSAYQPGPEWAEKRHDTIPAQNQAIMSATSVDDMFKRLEESNQLLRLTDRVWPTMFRCATVSALELEKLQEVTNIVRKGRIVSIGTSQVTFEGGSSYQPPPDTLFVDCSADGLEKHAPVPVFKGKQITLQSVRLCQQVFSAAFIAHAEAAYDDDTMKNKLCRPIPHPSKAYEWLLVTLLNNENTLLWLSQPKTSAWLAQSRLDWFGTLMPPMPVDVDQQNEIRKSMAKEMTEVCQKLRDLLHQLPAGDVKNIEAQILQLS
ncbi:unnamed protein product [Clonostachys byssicola]|uniref:Uncharacterized protein n=1 Tax=Clonostachys byssicola TaxID=160290 RepID=A0A9N9UAB0_9HYPO|nr:unnamed protein product [Clonostachys byssicola]